MNDEGNSGTQFDPISIIEKYSQHLNAINEATTDCDAIYELMSGALVWRDELVPDLPIKLQHALRSVFAFRTSLMLGVPREELQPVWEVALRLCPDWIGFRIERRTLTPALHEVYQRERAKTVKCMERIFGV